MIDQPSASPARALRGRFVPFCLLVLPAGAPSGPENSHPPPIASAPGDAWPAFRGVGSSHTSARDLPRTWSEQENLAWSVELPGYGQSSPVVFGDRVFATSVAGENKEHGLVTCLRLSDGQILWTHRFEASLKIESSDMTSRGAPTPVVDAERVYAFFESGDLLALDHDGRLAWKRSLSDEYGAFGGNHGIGGSPALANDAVVLLVDHDGPSYLIAVSRHDGRNVWKVDRDPRMSWSSPVVIRAGAGEAVVLSSNGVVEAFSAADGERLFAIDGIQGNTIASPSVAGDLVVIGSSDPSGNMALRWNRRHPKRPPEILWRSEKASCSFGSPLVCRGMVFLVNKSGALSCLDLETGRTLWKHRLADSCWASPLYDGELAWFFTKGGHTTVLRPTRDGPVVVAENSLPADDRVYGVAAVDGCFVIREGNRLRCVRSPGDD